MSFDDTDPTLPEIPARPGGPGFVDRVLRAVLDDRADRDADARAWDADPVGLPAEVRAAHTTPEPTRDFVERTAARVLEERARRGANDAAIARALADTAGWPRSPDFVDRTLSALRVDKSGLRLVRGSAADDADTPARPAGRAVRSPHVARSTPEPVRKPHARRRWLTAAAAALVVAIGGFAAYAAGTGAASDAREESAPPLVAENVPDDVPPAPSTPVVSTQSWSPVEFGTALARLDEATDPGLRFEQGDPLLLLASAAEETR